MESDRRIGNACVLLRSGWRDASDDETDGTRRWCAVRHCYCLILFAFPTGDGDGGGLIDLSLLLAIHRYHRYSNENAMTLYLLFPFRPTPLPPALPYLRASNKSPPSGSWDERAAAMIVWRASPPACLPVVDLPVTPRRCRLVGRGVERVVFVIGSVLTICPVLVSSCRLVDVAHILGGLLR